MIKILFALFFSISFLFVSCSNEETIVNAPPNQDGALKIIFDKVNAPSNVFVIIATLSRQGFQDITGNLNIRTDSMADISFETVASGLWHLKVDAQDSNSVIVYTGETGINVLEGVVTNVSIELQPVSSGTGKVYILVTWGKNKTWQDYVHNPILTPFNNEYDYRGIIQSYVFKDGNKYKMWYAGVVNSGKKYVMYAESDDGIYWNKTLSTPVLSPSSNNWDSWAVHPGPIIKENNLYRMYYSGWSDQYGRWDIGLAYSIDGVNWEKQPNPVITGSTGWEYQVIPWSIIKVDSNYYLYYSGRGNYPQTKIGLAISSDGINWTKYNSNPILQASFSWENGGVFQPSVIFDEGKYKMAYMNVNSTAFGLATSENGKLWSKSETPFFKVENTRNHWAYEIAYPHLIKCGEELRCYYTGFTTNEYAYGKIAFAKKVN